MLIRVGPDRTESIDLTLAALLSTIAGGLNAVGFVLAGSFTANMTGNVSGLAEDVVAGRLLSALSFAGLLAAFICGAWLTALAIGAGERRGWRGIYALAIVGEALILLALGLALLRDSSAQLAMVFVLSFVMGLQNAATTMISKARVRTTHVSGMATDLGISLAALFGTAPARAEALPRLRLHGLTLACFALGGIAWLVAYGLLGTLVFEITAIMLLAIALPEVIRARRLRG